MAIAEASCISESINCNSLDLTSADISDSTIALWSGAIAINAAVLAPCFIAGRMLDRSSRVVATIAAPTFSGGKQVSAAAFSSGVTDAKALANSCIVISSNAAFPSSGVIPFNTTKSLSQYRLACAIGAGD